MDKSAIEYEPNAGSQMFRTHGEGRNHTILVCTQVGRKAILIETCGNNPMFTIEQATEIYQKLGQILTDIEESKTPTSIEQERIYELNQKLKQATIEQELEYGLKDRLLHSLKCMALCVDGRECTCTPTQPVTRIYLPMAKYEEFGIYACTGDRDGTPAFHDIPVFSTNDTETRFCTD